MWKKIANFFRDLFSGGRHTYPSSPEHYVEKPVEKVDNPPPAPLHPTPVLTTIQDALIRWAERQVGVREKGYNKGKEVEEYQDVIGKAEGESWCLSFCQAGAKFVCDMFGVKNPLFPTETCTELWAKTPAKYKLPPNKGGRGMIGIMKVREHSWKGHAYLRVSPFLQDLFSWISIEGNTNSAGSREGDGVYQKTQAVGGTITKELLGFINLPQMILDKVNEKK